MAGNSQFMMAIHICVAVGYIEKHQSSLPAEEVLVKSNILAGSVNTNPALVRRIIAQLVHANLIQSFEGRSGGFKLALPAEKITLLNIYLAIGEQNFFALNPNPPNNKCPISRNIVSLVEEVFIDVDVQVKNKLQSVTVSQLISKIEALA